MISIINFTTWSVKKNFVMNNQNKKYFFKKTYTNFKNIFDFIKNKNCLNILVNQ